MSQQCRSCGAEVIFVPSAKTGKPMILDAKPEKRVIRASAETIGLLAVVDRGLAGSYDVALVVDAYALVVDAYVDHHATCPAAAVWKGRTRADTP